jgi:hypothetical protein
MRGGPALSPDEVFLRDVNMDEAERRQQEALARRVRWPVPRNAPTQPERGAAYFQGIRARLQHAAFRGFHPRSPFVRVWPVVREIIVVMSITITVVSVAPQAFRALPDPFHVEESAPLASQVRAALTGAGVAGVFFLVQFSLWGVAYLRRWTQMQHALVTIWFGGFLGVPLGLLLWRCCEAFNVPLDAPTLIFATWNLVVPGVVLVQWAPTEEVPPETTDPRNAVFLRRLYVHLLAIVDVWVLACVPWPSLSALLGLFAMLDLLLVAMPCCSPVQSLDKLVRARQRAGEYQMPGVTFAASGSDGLFLGLGDFIVFSVFSAHAARGGVAPLIAVFVGLIAALSAIMIKVALAWPGRALEPVLPLSVALGSVVLAASLVAREASLLLASSGVWI